MLVTCARGLRGVAARPPPVPPPPAWGRPEKHACQRGRGGGVCKYPHTGGSGVWGGGLGSWSKQRCRRPRSGNEGLRPGRGRPGAGAGCPRQALRPRRPPKARGRGARLAWGGRAGSGAGGAGGAGLRRRGPSSSAQAFSLCLCLCLCLCLSLSLSLSLRALLCLFYSLSLHSLGSKIWMIYIPSLLFLSDLILFVSPFQ